MIWECFAVFEPGQLGIRVLTLEILWMDLKKAVNVRKPSNTIELKVFFMKELAKIPYKLMCMADTQLV